LLLTKRQVSLRNLILIGVKYAIKAIDKKRVQDYETFVTEVKVLKKTVKLIFLTLQDHPSIIKLVEVWEMKKKEEDICFLVLE